MIWDGDRTFIKRRRSRRAHLPGGQDNQWEITKGPFACQQLAGDRPFGDLPLIILTAGQMSAPGSTPFDERTIPVPDQQIALQRSLAGQSSLGEQRVIARSGHSVHLDAPEEVIRAVQDLVQRIRKTN